MAWRNKAQITGQNMVPLGATRRWGGAGGAGGGGDDSASPSGFGGSLNGNGAASSSQGYGNGNNQQFVVPQYNSGGMLKRERDEESPANGPGAPSASASSADTPRKRRSRWGEEKTDLGVTTALGANVSEAEVERYAINVRIEEIARRLRSGDVVPPDRERSPSPTPTYDAQGRRTNTREVRYRKKLEEERVRLVDKQIKLDPNYKPPAEYTAAKRNMKPTEKIFLPIKEFPELNFFGLLVGPRGNSLKKMERESGAKISIRGKGSVKHGKGRAEDGDEEEMHCVITADDEESVKRCIRLINTVIETAASTPEAQNDHKRNQLRELAALNGTLRDDENQVCQNCGQKGHRKYECPEQRNWTANIVCHRCGQQGHLARDCTEGRGFPGVAAPGAGAGAGPRQGDPFNSEYESLMAELGQGGNANSAVGGQSGPVPTGPGARGGGTSAGPMDRPLDPDGKKIPPWRDPNVWNTPTFGGGPPRGPRMGMGYGGPNGGGGGGGYGGQHQQQPYMQQHRHQQQWGGAQQQQGAFGGFAQQYQQSEQPEGAAGAMAGQEQYANVNGGQPDYRQAWEEYYRQQGMDPAAAAAAAASAAAGGTGAADVQHAQSQQEPQSQQSQQQQDYSKEWEEYYRQQAAAAGSQQ